MYRHFHASSLINDPSLDLQHRIIQDLNTVQMILHKIFFDQFIQFVCTDLPDTDTFFTVAEKKFQTLIFLCQFQYLRDLNGKSRQKIPEFTSKSLCDIRPLPSLDLWQFYRIIAISQKFKSIYFSVRM